MSLFPFFVSLPGLSFVRINMNQYSHQKQPSGYPSQPAATAYPAGPYVVPPPAVYPMKDGHHYPQKPAAVETKARGDGFWKGWYVYITLYISVFFFFNYLLILYTHIDDGD